MLVLTVIQSVVIVLLAVLVVGLLRSHAEILRALHDLGVNLDEPASNRPAQPSTGSASLFTVGTNESGLARPVDGPLGDARDILGVTVEGDAVAAAVTSVGRVTLLAFLTSGCSSCLDFWTAFANPAKRAVAGIESNLVIVTKGPATESPAAVAEVAPRDVSVIMSSDAFEDYQVAVAPYFVLVDGATSAVIGEGAASTFGQLDSLLGKALADRGVGQGGRRTRRDVLGGRARAARVDQGLEAAGIVPGHDSLYPRP